MLAAAIEAGENTIAPGLDEATGVAVAVVVAVGEAMGVELDAGLGVALAGGVALDVAVGAGEAEARGVSVLVGPFSHAVMLVAMRKPATRKRAGRIMRADTPHPAQSHLAEVGS